MTPAGSVLEAALEAGIYIPHLCYHPDLPAVDNCKLCVVHSRRQLSFFIVFLVWTVVFNIIGEELYYRGFLLPKMRGTFGRWDWVANGLLFTLKHGYQRWLYPAIVPSGLGLAFVAGPLGRLPLAMVFHWLGNNLLSFIQFIPAIFGGG